MVIDSDLQKWILNVLIFFIFFKKGIPIIQSSPHFLFCDEKYLSQVEGLKPDINKHRTQLYVEPTSGVLMKANKRIQFNTQLPLDQRIT